MEQREEDAESVCAWDHKSAVAGDGLNGRTLRARLYNW